MLGYFVPSLLLFLATVPLQSRADEVIDPAKLREIKFEKIPPTKAEFNDSVLKLTVNKSSSAYIFPYPKIRSVEHMSVEWQSTINVGDLNPRVEVTKDGDDFPLRIGLIVSGRAPWIPIFAPSWIKAVAETLNFPTNRMIYGVHGSLQPAGSKWPSPFSDSIENVAVPSTRLESGFNSSQWDFPKLQIVGYWIMADGDNRKISFETKLKSLKIW